MMPMNSKIKPRDKIPDENTQQKVNTYALVNRTVKAERTVDNIEKPKALATRPKPQPIKTTNALRSTVSPKALSSPLRAGDLQKLAFQAGHHDVLFISIHQIQRGLKLTLSCSPENCCLITLTLDTTEIDRNKVKHSFPMPQLLNTTKYIKLPVRDFSEEEFAIVVQPIKGRIRDGVVLFQHPDQQALAVVEVDPLGWVEEAERIRRRKFEGKDWTLKASKSATVLRELCSPKQQTAGQLFRKELGKPARVDALSSISYSTNEIKAESSKDISNFLKPSMQSLQNPKGLFSPPTKTLLRVTSGGYLIKANSKLESKQQPSTASTFKKKQPQPKPLDSKSKFCTVNKTTKPQTALTVSRMLDYDTTSRRR